MCESYIIAVMKPLKLIFMGTPEFALPTLKALGESEHSVVAVYTQPPRPAGRGHKERLSPVHAYAASKNIPVFTPATLKAEETQRRFREHSADAAIVAAYGLLLPDAILEGTRMGCINVHPSLLPRWRGAAPIQRAVMAGDRETGIVIMQMNAGLDTGDMLMVEHFALMFDGGTENIMTAGEVHDALAGRAASMVLRTLEGLEDGTITPVKQPEEGVTYAKKISKEECRIDWREPAKTLQHKILGLSPHPGAYFIYNNETIKILDARFYPMKKMFEGIVPGKVFDNLLTIVCGEGALVPELIQRPGKKPMPAREMLKGCSIPQGTQLELP